MTLAMQACARANLPVVVLDRPNPLGGIEMDGNVATSSTRRSSALPLAVRHGADHCRAGAYLNETHGFAPT